MRNFTLKGILFLALLAPLGLAAQVIPASQVCVSARNNFTTSVAGVTPQWKSGSKGSFEAWFNQEGVQKVYVYDSQGNLRIKKSGAKSGELPPSITASLFKQYGKGDFQNAFKVMTAEKKKYYEIVVARPTGNDLWQFSPEGALLGKRISSGSEATGSVATSSGTQSGTPPRADASPVPNAPDYEEEDTKDLGTNIEDNLEILDEDPLEDIDILDEDVDDSDLLDEDLLEDEDLDDESFDDDIDEDLN